MPFLTQYHSPHNPLAGGDVTVTQKDGLADLTAARRTYELHRRDEITVNIDYAQCGLGNASCGPGVLPPYMLLAEPCSFGVVLGPLA